MSALTQEEKETFDVFLCKPETYLEILDNLSYYSIQGNQKAVKVFQALKREMESTCEISNIHRSLRIQNHSHIVNPTSKKFTYRGFTLFEINEDGKLKFIPPEQETPKIKEPIPEALLALRSLTSKQVEEYEHPLIRNKRVPKICDPSQCELVACPQRNNQDQWGKPCIYRVKPNPSTPQTDPLTIANRSLNPNEPDYHSPKFQQQQPAKPKKALFRETLNPT